MLCDACGKLKARNRLPHYNDLPIRPQTPVLDGVVVHVAGQQNRAELAGSGCTTTMHLVEINAQPIAGENNSRDFDFSRAAVQTRWRAGYVDTCRMLARQPWDDPIDPATAVTVYRSGALG